MKTPLVVPSHSALTASMAEPAAKRQRHLYDAASSTGSNPIQLVYSSDFQSNSSDLVLLEVPSKLANELAQDLSDGIVNIVGGGENEEAVIVTSRETFKMTRVETSNTVLLLPAAMDHRCQTANGSDDATEQSRRYANLASRPLCHRVRQCTVRTVSYAIYFRMVLASRHVANKHSTYTTCTFCVLHFELTKSHPDLEHIRVLLAKNPYRGQDAEDPSRTVYTLQQLEEAVRISPVELLVGLEKLGALQINNR
eukprot:16231-Heterococcus_DN1.PRE.5